MKFDYASDLHLEFGGISELFFHPTESWRKNSESSVLILAGDIVEARMFCGKTAKAGLVHEAFEKLSNMYEHVFWVFGNHEYYGETLEYAIAHVRTKLDKLGLKNFHVLENDTFVHGDVTFFGGTMWTSFHNGNPLEMMRFYNMNDSRYIKCYDANDRSWKREVNANEILSLHLKFTKKLHNFLSDTSGKKVVVTHHAPSAIVVADKWRGDPMNSCYVEELGEVISYAQPNAWVFGHLHNHEYLPQSIGNTSILSNTRGYYGHDKVIGFQPKQYEV